MGSVLRLVLPGIGGSVLAERREDAYAVAWDAGFVDVAELVLRPDRLALDRDLIAVGAIRSRRLLPGWTVIHGYEGLILALADGGKVDWGHPDVDHRVDDADVVVVPYDWRRSVVSGATELDRVVTERLGGLTEVEREKRVQIVAHSMGGLVARYWLGPMGRWRWCHSLVTLGTPHRGAPKALDTVVNGVRIRRRLLDRVVISGATDLLRSFPSVYELLPRYPAVLFEGSGIYPKDLQLDARVPGFSAMAGQAFAVHEAIETAWTDMPWSGPVVVPVMSWNSGTLSSAEWNGDQLDVNERFPVWLRLREWEDDAGDGTVPMLSAVPIEMGGEPRSWRRGLERHGPLASASIGAQVAQDLVRLDPRAARGDHRHRAAAGLVIDEWATAHDTVPCGADLRNVELGDGRLWVTAFEAVGRRQRRTRIELTDRDDAGRFHGELPPLEAGQYRVRLEVLNTPVGDLDPIEDVIDVVQ